MGNSSGKSLAVAGLIIGILGILLGGYSSFTIVSNTASNIRGSWYDSVESDFSLNNNGVYSTISGLSITITINSGEKVYLLFNSRVILADDANQVCFDVYIDNMKNKNSSFIFERSYSVGMAETLSFTLQYVNNTLNPGTHVITIKGTTAGGSSPISKVLKNSNLFVQTYI